MNLKTAISRIEQSFVKMNDAYHRTVFDEIAIVGLNDTGMKLLHYGGPNQPAFMTGFADKTVLLRKELTGEKAETGGEFGFTREAEGENFDAYICLGPDVYLFCNNTEKSMDEVTQDPRWLAAQSVFLNISQLFAAEPVEVVEGIDS